MKSIVADAPLSDEAVDPELSERLLKLEKKSAEMDEGIRYAGSLQQSILPNERLFVNTFKDAFVLFQPRDIVSGDFYWIYLHHDDIYFAVGDCTGHGVPGALLNIAGNSILRQIIRIEGLSDPKDIVRLLDTELVSMFNENLTSGTTRDGMEIALCKFNLNKGVGQFCGAGRPMLLMRNSVLVEFRKGIDSIGYSEQPDKTFESYEFPLFSGDRFYLFSDGYTDQFGGENIKKFNRKRFKSLIESVHQMPMSRQKKELWASYSSWKGKQEQIDDICVIGIEI